MILLATETLMASAVTYDASSRPGKRRLRRYPGVPVRPSGMRFFMSAR